MPIEPKSILSRFSSPLTKRSAKLFDFEIEPEHPHKTYRPGDSVKGHISLNVSKGFDITHLTISLHGYVQVFKHQCTPGEAKVTPEQLFDGKGSHGFEYFGNGLASLFQDEQILCGSGFLKKQVYKFGFELRFPKISLPSTIEFERGAVNYMVSATVTRPTAIAPTTNRMYKVKFENCIDIGSMYTPKSRAIYLEPIKRRGKVKKVTKTSTTGIDDALLGLSLSRQNTSHSTRTRSSTTVPQEPPLSPAPSEGTIATHRTDSSQSLRMVEHETPPRKRSVNSEPRSTTTTNSAHTISATTEIQRHGALPGDFIPVRVKVEHSKAARGVVIATLYRQGRIDMLPALPLASRTKDKKPEYEDVYPKSRTGLGGLYFTKGAPNVAFRKDLSQTSTMMVVDPQSKTADVHFKVKIPNDAFPTIDNIPGGMISFTYHIEVVIDLTGKLGESRLLPSLTTNGPSFSNPADGSGHQVTHDWANNILDTAPLRRTKNVAAFELPITVGTDDSARLKNQREALAKDYSYHGKENFTAHGRHDSEQEWHEDEYNHFYQHYDHHGHDTYDHGWYDEYGNPLYDGWHDPHQHPYHHPQTNGDYNYSLHTSHQSPAPQNGETLDEKSRLRRHEELLLPSAPPTLEGPSSQRQTFAPSAPVFDGNSNRDYPLNSSSPSIPITISRSSGRSAETIVPDPLTPPPSLPEDGIPSLTEDKQELERQRLATLASAPPAEDQDSPGPSERSRADAPSAPMIDEGIEYIAHVLRQEGNDTLPQYQR